MPWFHFIASIYMLFNVMENIHCCSVFASWIFFMTLESLAAIIAQKIAARCVQ